MKKILLKILISFSLVLLSPFSMASNLSEEVFDQSCNACASCCSSYDNVEIIESTNIKKSKKKKKKKPKKAKSSRKSKRTSKPGKSKVRKLRKSSTVKKAKKAKRAKNIRKSKQAKKRLVPIAKASKKTSPKKVTASTTDNMWLKKQLHGSSIATAALSPIKTYTNEKNQFRVVIDSLFAFDCELKFDSRAQPSLLSDCLVKSTNSKLKVKESSIPLNCSNTEISKTCTGNYTLMFSDNDDNNETHKMTIAKRI